MPDPYSGSGAYPAKLWATLLVFVLVVQGVGFTTTTSSGGCGQSSSYQGRWVKLAVLMAALVAPSMACSAGKEASGGQPGESLPCHPSLPSLSRSPLWRKWPLMLRAQLPWPSGVSDPQTPEPHLLPAKSSVDIVTLLFPVDGGSGAEREEDCWVSGTTGDPAHTVHS